MKYFVVIALALSFVGCKNTTDKTTLNGKILATVNSKKLYESRVNDLLNKNLSEKDKEIAIRKIVNQWAKRQLLFQKAKENLKEEEEEEIASLLMNYKESLFINGYKEKLVKQGLDTVVSLSKMEAFYKKNASNFKLNEVLVKIKYLHLAKDLPIQKEVIALFKSDEIEDIENLQKRAHNFKNLFLNDSSWVSLDKFLTKNVELRSISKEKLLKKSKFIQKEDSLGLYLVAIKKVLKRNEVAPLSYVLPRIKQMVLHRRKLELIRDIEKTLVNDAIQNKNFKEY